jgi:hypothetical protein
VMADLARLETMLRFTFTTLNSQIDALSRSLYRTHRDLIALAGLLSQKGSRLTRMSGRRRPRQSMPLIKLTRCSTHALTRARSYSGDSWPVKRSLTKKRTNGFETSKREVRDETRARPMIAALTARAPNRQRG